LSGLALPTLAQSSSTQLGRKRRSTKNAPRSLSGAEDHLRVDEFKDVPALTVASRNGDAGGGPEPSSSPVQVQASDPAASTSQPYNLRNYQQEAIDAVIESYSQGICRQLLAMPTGAGKTVVFTALARHLNRRTLILTHRYELLEQTVDKLRAMWPETSVGSLQGRKDEYSRDVVVATVQTACQPKRLDRLESQGFEVLIVDEAHHSTAPTYRAIMQQLGFLEPTSNKLLVGVTATPYRRDKALLSEIYEHLAYDVTLGELIRQGYLAHVSAVRIMTPTDISALKAERTSPTSEEQDSEDEADFSDAALTKTINTPERNTLVVRSYQQLAGGRKAVAFCCSIDHAENMAELFRDLGVPAEALHSGLDYERRKELLDMHNRGEVSVLTNVGILTEGYDDTGISCILMARPTKSAALYTQCVGRGLRLHSGKAECLVMDFTDKCHQLDRPAQLITCVDIVGRANGVFRNYDGPPPSVVEEIKELLQGGRLELFNTAKLAWVRYCRTYYLNSRISLSSSVWQDVTLRVRPQPGGRAGTSSWVLEVATCKTPEVKSATWLQVGEAFTARADLRALQIAEEMLRTAQTLALPPGGVFRQSKVLAPASYRSCLGFVNRKAEWRSKPASDKQLDMLKRLGVSADNLLSWLGLPTPTSSTTPAATSTTSPANAASTSTGSPSTTSRTSAAPTAAPETPTSAAIAEAVAMELGSSAGPERKTRGKGRGRRAKAAAEAEESAAAESGSGVRRGASDSGAASATPSDAAPAPAAASTRGSDALSEAVKLQELFDSMTRGTVSDVTTLVMIDRAMTGRQVFGAPPPSWASAPASDKQKDYLAFLVDKLRAQVERHAAAAGQQAPGPAASTPAASAPAAAPGTPGSLPGAVQKAAQVLHELRAQQRASGSTANKLEVSHSIERAQAALHALQASSAKGGVDRAAEVGLLLQGQE